MPRVTDAHRESRREQITAAAFACFAENGFQRTSMADIIRASGLSAGAIYLHFASKQEIALAVARRVLDRRIGELDALGASDSRDPVDVLRLVLSAMIDEIVDARVLVQLWGEATTDPAMAALVREIFGTLRVAWVRYLTSWGARQGIAEPADWAESAIPALLGIAQGFLLQRALVPGFDPDGYFASVRVLVDPGLTIRG